MDQHKQQAATLIHKIKSRINTIQDQALRNYFETGELLTSLKAAGPTIWTSYDPECKSWRRMCASIGVKSSNADNCISITSRFRKPCELDGIKISQNKLRLLLSVKFDTPEKEREYLHAFSQLSTRECRDLLRQAKGKPTTQHCEHKNTEPWAKCTDCSHWIKL